MQPELIIGLFAAENPGLEVLHNLGAGGNGAVFKCFQSDLDRTVAVKVMNVEMPIGSSDSRLRFHREAKILSELTHSGLPQFYSFGLCQNRFPYIVMEFVDGCTLSELLNEQPRLPWAQVSSLALQICSVMTYLQKAGVMHRDLNPNNILLESRRIEGSGVRLIDFGLAAKEDLQKLTQTGDILGTPQYMSPEVCNGRPATDASDIYSLGCILYRCLSGRLPHQADSPAAIMAKHVSEEPAALPEAVAQQLPRGLESVISACLAKAPAERYSSMEEVARDIQLCIDDLPPHLTPALRVRQRRRKLLLNGAFVLILIGCLVVLLQWRSVLVWSAGALPLTGADPLRLALSSEVLRQMEAIGATAAAQQLRLRMLRSNLPHTLEAARLCLRFSRQALSPGERREWLLLGLEQLPASQSKQTVALFEDLCKPSFEVAKRSDDRFEWQVRKVIDAMEQSYPAEAMPIAYELVTKFILAHREPRREDAKYLLEACTGMIRSHRYVEALTLTDEMDRYFKRFPSMVKNTIYSLQLRMLATRDVTPAKLPVLASSMVSRALNSEDPDTERVLCTSCNTLAVCGRYAEAGKLVPHLESLVAGKKAGTPVYNSLVLLKLRQGKFADAEALARKFLLSEPEKDSPGEVLHEFFVESLVGQHRCKEAARVLIALLEDKEYRLVPYHFIPAAEKVRQCTGEEVKAELERIKALMQQRAMDIPAEASR